MGQCASNLLLRGPGAMVCTDQPPVGMDLMSPHKSALKVRESTQQRREYLSSSYR